ncbi:hypothetical protein WA556_000592, partial [Blastocystis sp. ATCC 50177/Nand II]
MEQDYFSTVLRAFVNQDSALLCSCITNDLKKHYGGRALVFKLVRFKTDAIHIFPPNAQPFEELVYCHLRALKYLLAANEKMVWASQKKILEICVSFLQEENSEWMTPCILQWCRESRKLAYSLSKASGLIKESKEVSECTMILRNVCTAFNNKKNVMGGGLNGFVGSVNELSKILFAQSNIRLCQDIYESYRDRIAAELQQAPASQACTFYYYCGRLRLYEDDYHGARDALTRALSLCDPNAPHNLQMVLFFLIPVNMLFGRLPSQAVLDRFHFTMYQKLAQAVRTGDLPLYDRVLTDYATVLVTRCLYLTVVSLKVLVQRSFLKRVITAYGSAQIPFQAIHKGFDLLRLHESDDELCCMLSVLKYKGYLKGYVSFTQKTLVVSKTQPFPPISS